MTLAHHSLPSFVRPLEMQTATNVLPLQMPTSSFRRNLDPNADTGLIDWDRIVPDHSGEWAQTLEADGGIKTAAERKLQAAHPADLRREAEKRTVEANC